MTSVDWTLLILVFPVIAGAILWWRSREIVWWESALSVAAAALILLLTFALARLGEGWDTETWSGYATRAVHTPKWRAEWEEYVPPTYDSEGNQTGGGYWETHSRNYPPKWWFETHVGDVTISESLFQEAGGEFGIYKEKGRRPHYDSGDEYDYFVDIKNVPGLPEYPVHVTRKWDNPIKGTDSIHLGRPITEEEAAQNRLYPYPKSMNPLRSHRLVGKAEVSRYRWDQLNAVLGPSKKVNLILVNFGDRGLEKAVLLRDYWRNGRKNDLVLCYGEGWSYVFGWSQTELVKQELQSLLLGEEVNDDIVPRIEEIVKRDFTRYDWEQLAGTPRPAKAWVVILAFVMMAASQVGLYIAFHTNYESKIL